MICNRNGITSVGRWEFVKAFVEDFVAILVAIHFATPFATKNDRENFVEISSKISLLQLKFDEIWTNCLTKFWQFFFVAKCCGKTFCHNILPQKKIVKISSNNSFKFRQTWVEVTKSLTKFQRNSHDHFLWQKVWQNGLPQGLPRNLQRKL